MDISYEPGDFGDNRIEVSPDDIRHATSVADLLKWMGLFQDMKGDIQAQLEAREACGIEDDDWYDRVCSALSFAGMGLTRTKRRLRELGINPDPLPVEDRKALDKAKEGARFAKHLLVAMGEALPRDTVQAIKAVAMDRAIEKAFAA